MEQWLQERTDGFKEVKNKITSKRNKNIFENKEHSQKPLQDKSLNRISVKS